MTHAHFVFTCPNPKCAVAIPSARRTRFCPDCGTYLFPVRPPGEHEDVRTHPGLLAPWQRDRLPAPPLGLSDV